MNLSRRFHPLVRLAAKRELENMGKRPVQIARAMLRYDPDLIEIAAENAKVTLPACCFDSDDADDPARGGPIIDAIKQFIASDTFKTLVQALVKLLLGALIV